MEHTREDNVINDIKEASKLFNEVRCNLTFEETKRIRYKLRKKEPVYNSLKEKEQEGSLTNREKNVLRNIGSYPKNIVNHLKNFRKHFKKLQKYQYGLDYLFNERNEEDYITEPTSQDNIINDIKEVRKLCNEARSNLFHEETKRISYKFHKKVNLATREKRLLKNMNRYFRKIKEDLSKIKTSIQCYS